MLEAQADGLIGPSQFTFAKGFLMLRRHQACGELRPPAHPADRQLPRGRRARVLDLGPGTSQIALGVLFIVVTLTVPGGLIGGAESLVRRIAAGGDATVNVELALTGEAPA